MFKNMESNRNFASFYRTLCGHGKYLEDASTNESDEISRSLQMFAMLAINKADPPEFPVDAVRQEFACNGYNCDELIYCKDNNVNFRSNIWKVKLSTTTDYLRKPIKKRLNGTKNERNVLKHCVFCENNNQPLAVVKSHSVRDVHHKVLCPTLRIYVCPICGATGDNAHTVKYCPKKPIITMEDTIKAEAIRLKRFRFN